MSVLLGGLCLSEFSRIVNRIHEFEQDFLFYFDFTRKR